MNSVRDQKNLIRKELMSLREEISSEERKRAEDAIVSRFLSLATYRHAETVLMYSPIKNEPNVMAIFDAAIKAGKNVAFPRCDSESCTMTYHLVSSIDRLTNGTYGILEPDSSLEVYTPDKSETDIIIVPAVSYDKSGYRIGYGKGYYDRFLCSFKGTSVGITFSKLLKNELPRGKYDKKVSIVLTERGVFATL